jgi:endonuclease/exonuclease/phosphatase family metal-dependent hydrolase
MVRVGTWNLENLFRPGAVAGPSDEPAYRAKINALARVIAELAPDVLAVQEVGDPAALADVADAAGGRWHTHTADPDARGIRVGFLSRLQPTEVSQFADFPVGLNPVQVDDTGIPAATMGRSGLRARVEVGGWVLDLVTCHLKSKLLTFPGSRFNTNDEAERARFAAFALNRRAAEAVTVRAAATRLLAAAGSRDGVVVLGDLNDGPEAATTQILYGPPGSQLGTGGYQRPDRGDGQRLWNLAARIPAEQRYSRMHLGQPELIDHILVSHFLVDRVGDVTTGPGPTPSITDNPTARQDASASDHRPLLATITL